MADVTVTLTREECRANARALDALVRSMQGMTDHDLWSSALVKVDAALAAAEQEGGDDG